MANTPPQRNAAIEALKEKMSRDPFSRAFLQLAEEYRREGRYEDAIKVCLEGLSRHPAYHTARIALGRTYLEAGNLEEARQALGEVLALAPENHLAGKLLAEVQRKMGDLAGAAETYRGILVHYPGDVEVKALLHDLVGAAPAPLAKPPAPAARAPVPTAAARRPADPVPDFRSEDLAATGLLPPPVMPEVRADGASDRDALQTNTLAELYLRQGLVERALEVYRSMLKMDPGNVRAHRRLMELTGSPGPVPDPVVPGLPPAVVTDPIAIAPAAPPAAPVVSAPVAPPPTVVTRPAPPTERSRARIARLEGWLEQIHAPRREGVVR